MTKTRLFRLWLVLGSVFMVLLIIVYWDNVGTAHFYLHTSFPRPRPTPAQGAEKEFTADVDAFLQKLLSGGLKQSAPSGRRTEQPSVPASGRPVLSNAEESVRGYDWSARDAQQGPDPGGRQAERRSVLRGLCANASFVFPTKERSFDDIPNYELNHLIVDDRHGVIYCYVPKVACTNWKRVLLALSGRARGDPRAIPAHEAHAPGRLPSLADFSPAEINRRLRAYLAFLFVREPFERLASAYRNKLARPYSAAFQRRYGTRIVRRLRPRAHPDALARGHDVRFAEFLAYLLDPRTRREEPFNEHWERAHALCHPCRLRYDVVGKFETLAEDAAFVLDLVGAPGLRFPAPPPRAKAAAARDLAERLFRDISPFYQRRLYDLYRMDFLLFNYSAPSYLRLH